MNTTIGTGMTSIAQSIPNDNLQNYYYTRFVSVPLFQSSISANTWTYNFAAAQMATFTNFPVTGSNQPVRVNCYVWRPGTSTKIGTILDGNTASTVTEGSSNQIRNHHVTFSGSSVSSMQNNDVIIFEVWFLVDPDFGGSFWTGTFYYDGTTVNTTPNSTVSNHASFLETPENLQLVGMTHYDRTTGESVTVADAIAKQKKVNRAISVSATISDDVVRLTRAGRSIAASLTIVDDVTRKLVTAKSLSESFTIAGVGDGAKFFGRSVVESLMLADSVARLSMMRRSASEALTISASVARLRRVLRSVIGTVVISDVAERTFKRIRLASATVTISDDIAKDYSGHRSVTETAVIAQSMVRKYTAKRTATGALTILDIVSRHIVIPRTASESLTIAANVARVKRAIRAIAATVTINGIVTRFFDGARTLGETVAISAAANGRMFNEHIIGLDEALTIAASVARKRIIPRIMNQTIVILTTLITKLCRAEDE